MKILVKNGLVIDPVNKIEEVMDVLIEGARIAGVSKDIKTGADTVIDAKGKIVIPGLVDMHVHLREPGREDKETIETGTLSAAKGGVTSILCMPNTLPAIDCAKNVRLLKDIVKEKAKVSVFIAGAITIGRLGKRLCDISALKKEGVIAISDDGFSVDNSDVMLKSLLKAKKEEVLVICHCEDRSLSNKGVMNLGFTSTRLGLRGVSNESEYKRVERDIRLAEKVNANIHIAHVSCKESVEIIRKAKKKGIKVSAETAPHYFSLSEDDLLDYDTNMKVNPPLRTKEDVEAIKEGIKSDVIDVVASDHAPHTENEKDIEFEYAESGTIGLETELAAGITWLVHTGVIGWSELVRKMSYNPARILGIHKGTLSQAADADLIIVSPDREWMVKKDEIFSRSKNSAFLGRRLKGVVEYTIYKGAIVYKAS
jgi:dihydroorotase